MKNKIFLVLIILIASTPCAFAVQEGKVISDSATKKQVMEAFDDVNQYTNSFFTPKVIKKTLNSE